MNLWLIVPVKPFHEGKSRLAGVLPPAERVHLNRCLFTHVMHQALATPLLAGMIVVSRDPTVLQNIALPNIVSPNLHFVHEQGHDLNQALTQGRQAALAQAADAILILPADLPQITTADIETLCRLGEQTHGVILVPSTDNGTNALLLRPPTAIEFAFGRNSFTHHHHAAGQANLPCVVHHSATLAFDLDSPPDLVHLYPALTHRSQPKRTPHHSG